VPQKPASKTSSNWNAGNVHSCPLCAGRRRERNQRRQEKLSSMDNRFCTGTFGHSVHDHNVFRSTKWLNTQSNEHLEEDRSQREPVRRSDMWRTRLSFSRKCSSQLAYLSQLSDQTITEESAKHPFPPSRHHPIPIDLTAVLINLVPL